MTKRMTNDETPNDEGMPKPKPRTAAGGLRLRYLGCTFRSSLGIASVVIFLALGAIPAADKTGPLSGKEIYQRTLKSMVWIAHVVELGGGKAALTTGSGSLIDVPQRLILTNYHVVGNEKEVRVFFPQFDKQNKLIAAKDHYLQQLRMGGGLVGTVVYADHQRDLALIKVPKLPQGTTAIPMAREGVGPGDTVHSIGNPGASDALWAYTPGAVKAVYKKTWAVKDRTEGTMNFEAQVVETTSPVNPGDSGGPLLNGQGELVAVTQGGVVSAQGTISYFIDISEVRAVLAIRKIRVTSAAGRRRQRDRIQAGYADDSCSQPGREGREDGPSQIRVRRAVRPGSAGKGEGTAKRHHQDLSEYDSGKGCQRLAGEIERWMRPIRRDSRARRRPRPGRVHRFREHGPRLSGPPRPVRHRSRFGANGRKRASSSSKKPMPTGTGSSSTPALCTKRRSN